MPMMINGIPVATVLYGGNSISSSNNNYIVCDNVADMKTLSVTTEKVIIRTLGYYELNDGGGAEYLIRNSTSYTNDGVFDIELNNGMIAERILVDNNVNVLSLGIKKNSNKTVDVNYAAGKLKTMLEKYDSLYTVFFPAGTYYIWGIILDNDKSNSGRRLGFVGEHTSESNSAWNVNILTRGNDFLVTNKSQQDYITVKHISFDASNTDSVGTPLNKSGKCFSSEFANEFNFNLIGVRFANFEYGWYCTKFACGGSYAKDLTLLANKYGIYIPMATHGLRIEGLHCHYNMMAAYLPTGGTDNIISGFNYSPGYLSLDKDDYDEYIGIYTQGNGLTIDGMYLEDYLGSQVSPEKSIAIDYKCSGASKLIIKAGVFQNYAAAVGEKVLRYKGEYGKDNLILENCNISRNSIDMFAFDKGKVVTGIKIDGRNASVYGKNMYINELPHHYVANGIATSMSNSITIDDITYPCYQISMFEGNIENKDLIIGGENLKTEQRRYPTVGNWMSDTPSRMHVYGYFDFINISTDGKAKLFSNGKIIEFEIINGKAHVPIDFYVEEYNLSDTTKQERSIGFNIGTQIGETGTLKYSEFTNNTSYRLYFDPLDWKKYN